MPGAPSEGGLGIGAETPSLLGVKGFTDSAVTPFLSSGILPVLNIVAKIKNGRFLKRWLVKNAAEKHSWEVLKDEKEFTDRPVALA